MRAIRTDRRWSRSDSWTRRYIAAIVSAPMQASVDPDADDRLERSPSGGVGGGVHDV